MYNHLNIYGYIENFELAHFFFFKNPWIPALCAAQVYSGYLFFSAVQLFNLLFMIKKLWNATCKKTKELYLFWVYIILIRSNMEKVATTVQTYKLNDYLFLLLNYSYSVTLLSLSFNVTRHSLSFKVQCDPSEKQSLILKSHRKKKFVIN